jgi:hypothetical protein
MGVVSKTLAGCGCLALLVATVLVAGLGLGLFWLAEHGGDIAGLEGIPARTRDIDEWRRKANAHAWVARADGVIPEARLDVFLAVRRRVYAVYEVHRSALERLAERADVSGDRSPTPRDVRALGSAAVELVLDVRLARARALAEEGMSESEHDSIQTALYLAAAAAKAESRTGRLPAEAVSEATRHVREHVTAGVELARREGLPGADKISESDLRSLEEAVAEAGASGTRALTVPAANVDLYRAYKTDIEKYAMRGPALLGF